MKITLKIVKPCVFKMLQNVSGAGKQKHTKEAGAYLFKNILKNKMKILQFQNIKTKHKYILPAKM
jgi:hypothetical protein